jgi:hypothetical protein
MRQAACCCPDTIVSSDPAKTAVPGEIAASGASNRTPRALRSVAIKLVLVCQRSPATFVRATQPGPNPITTQFRHWHKKDCRP